MLRSNCSLPNDSFTLSLSEMLPYTPSSSFFSILFRTTPPKDSTNAGFRVISNLC